MVSEVRTQGRDDSDASGAPDDAPRSSARLRRGGRIALVPVLAVALLVGAVVAGVAIWLGGSDAVVLTNDDFRYGTYIIDEPGTYRLGEDIVFNPNSVETLNDVIADGVDAGELGLEAPVDAYQSGFPLAPQFTSDPVDGFQPGGPLDPRYDPAAYGIGFFAAISVTADDVTIDLDGHTIEQSAEHALLQRFFAIIELADQPFIPAQGPFDFGSDLDPARRVTIENGTIGNSAHHGIHGNGNEDITVVDVEFVDYEVAAVALNGVKGLEVRNVTATNTKNVPVLGTFSSAQFIKQFVNELVRTGSTTTLTVAGEPLDATAIQADLRDAINTTYTDVMTRGRIRPDHETAYALFHNPQGLPDGNSYSFLVNSIGVAVNGFPVTPDDDESIAEDVVFDNVQVTDQVAVINEVLAIDAGGKPTIDPVGAVFQTRNRHPDTGELITISPGVNAYTGNPVANAQAFVARAHASGEFANSRFDLSRLNISADVLDWVEGKIPFSRAGISYLCNGDSMFHVNKGVIAFKMDAVRGLEMTDTGVSGLSNLGVSGSDVCGDYSGGVSHPGATLPGYGGSVVRGYTFAGSHDVVVRDAVAEGLSARAGLVVGFDVLTDSSNIELTGLRVTDAEAGPVPATGPTAPATAYAVHVSAGADQVILTDVDGSELIGTDGQGIVDDESGRATLRP